MCTRPADIITHPLVIAGGIWIFVLATCLQTRGLLANELETLVYAKHWLDPSYIAGDWRLGMHPGPRLPFMVLIAPLLTMLPLEHAAVVGAVFGYLLVALALGVLFARLGLSLIEGLAVVGVFLSTNQSLTAGDFLFLNFEGKVVAYALVFFALASAARGPLVLAGVLLGFATTMHVIVGGWSTLAFAITVLTTGRGSPNERALAGGAYVLGALPGLIAIVSAEVPSYRPLPEGLTAEWIYVHLRAPHHLDPIGFLPRRLSREAVELALAFLAVVGFFGLSRSLERHDPRLFSARFVLATLVPAAIGLAAAFVPRGEKFLQFYPFRVADVMVLMLVPAVILAVLIPALRRYRLGMVVRSLVAIVAIVFAVRADPRESPERQPKGFEPVARFIREHAPAQRPVLISPHFDFAGYWMESPVVALWKFVPHDRRGIAEWYHRMVELAAIMPPDEPGGRPRRRRLEAFDTELSAEDYRTLAGHYDARYLVVSSRTDLELPLAFENDAFSVYEVGPD